MTAALLRESVNKEIDSSFNFFCQFLYSVRVYTKNFFALPDSVKFSIKGVFT